MFHLQHIELLHWDYCQRVSLPLDAAIVTIAGPNGSGKTTLLDALRTLLGLECSGGRSYKTYARHANANSAWLRAVVDNTPRNRQNASRPFATSLLYADHVTLACRIERNGGDWQRRYLLADGDVSVEELLERGDRDVLGLETWRKRLAAAGLTPAIARVLSLEQGQTDRLCEYNPRELLRLVFDVFGDQEVLDRYEQARGHQQNVAREVEVADRELAHAKNQLAELQLRVNNHQQFQLKLRERERLATEVVPVLRWAEQRRSIAERLRELHRQKLHFGAEARRRSALRGELLSLFEAQQAAEQRLDSLKAERSEAQQAQAQAREAERPVEALVKREAELNALAAVEGDPGQLVGRLKELSQRQSALREDWTRAQDALRSDEKALAELSGQRLPPPPPEVTRFRRTLEDAGIAHHLVADVVEVNDEAWRAAAEGLLRAARWVVVLGRAGDESQAMALAERERYRHYLVPAADAQSVHSGSVPAASMLAVLRVSAPLPGWLTQQLAKVKRVSGTEEGQRLGGEWITPQAYQRDGRGGRSVFVEPSQHQFGAGAVQGRRAAIEARLARAQQVLTGIAQAQHENDRHLADAQRAAQGHQAAEELAQRQGEFAQARSTLPTLQQARAQAGARWTALDQQHTAAVGDKGRAEAAYAQAQHTLGRSETDAERHERDVHQRQSELRASAAQSQRQRRQFPASWVTPAKLSGLIDAYDSAKQAELRQEAVQRELEQPHWETDATVEDRHLRMQHSVNEQAQQLSDRSASNEMARIAAHNARDRYIDVLRATVRRYRKNIQELGELAGVIVNAEPPHLDNDDTVLAQAGLAVKFSFDGKGEIGLNDGEASGGQQVLKSLILLVGLLKDDDTPGGFVFIDEPFAHLDVRNIQLVGHFLRSTRAQYLLTTPITHNVEVFEPADITLITSKKPRGARWAPPIAVLQRRGVPELVTS
jgi:chromosome segregation ATPase